RNGARRVRRMKRDDWRLLFLATRDHHHASRTCHGAWRRAEEGDDPDALRRLAYPIAHGRTIWAVSREHDVDPMLVLGLMRQESKYQATAVSRVGARGAMQIMPKTGHLIADRIGDLAFTAADLEDPEQAIGYGIRYLGLLLDRYDGVFPLAVASYNAGPFNVSSWLAGTGPHLPLDAFVEHIPFRETRDYVKRVTANYDTYTRLYGSEGVAVPPHPLGDQAEVVDF
ncbi:MAG: lytic transglycosylase domain-containing protein, partial [Myxococcota bacterium]